MNSIIERKVYDLLRNSSVWADAKIKDKGGPPPSDSDLDITIKED